MNREISLSFYFYTYNVLFVMSITNGGGEHMIDVGEDAIME